VINLFRKIKLNRTSVNHGFTLIEVLVASSLFVVLVVALTNLFNTTLKINRRGDALRQATQGVRNFMEFLTKEVRNGQIYYWVDNGTAVNTTDIGPCIHQSLGSKFYDGSPAGSGKVNKLGLINIEGIKECIYYADASGNAVLGNVFTASAGQKNTIVIENQKGYKETLIPPNINVENLVFFVRPICDPYSASCTGGVPKVQPFVNVSAKFVLTLPTGEQVPIYYQTAIGTNKYDVPNN
jgi:prepilin-type N-terminal cleavage/methylation domain-containing protein